MLPEIRTKGGYILHYSTSSADQTGIWYTKESEINFYLTPFSLF
jgi:hypothetical protein